MNKGGKLVLTEDGVLLKQQVETPVGKHFHETQIDYDELNRKMIYLKIERITPIRKEGSFKVEVNYSSFKRTEEVEEIKVVLRKSHIEYSHIYVPSEFRDFFPGYEIPFTVETNIGEIETYITGASAGTEKGNATAGSYFSKGMTEWFNAHPALEAGDKVMIEIVKPKERYKLRVKTIPKILLVEDNEQVLDLLRSTLERSSKFDCEIDIAKDGQEALAKLEEEQFGLVLADHKMPGMTGIELLSQVKGKYPDTIRVLITAYPDTITPEEKNKVGLWDCIEKPWERDELETSLQEALTTLRK